MIATKSTYALYILILIYIGTPISAQQITINEVASSNDIIQDEDGDSPDWFELRNKSNLNISLEGWSVSDRIDNPQKWTFPSTTIAPEGYLQLWASGKDRTNEGIPRTIIGDNTPLRYLASQTTTTSWTFIEYNDAFWNVGTAGIGYGDNDDNTLVPQGTISLIMRIPFTIGALDDVQQVLFDIDFDDAYVAYINGREIARSNVIDQGNGIFTAATDREASLYTGGQTEQHILHNFDEYLISGTNVLAIRLLNISTTSSDLTCRPFLTLLLDQATNIGSTPPSYLHISDSAYHTNFRLSNAGETIYLFDHMNQLVDSLAFANIPADASYGRIADGSLKYFTSPTPGSPNSGATFDGVVQDEVIYSHDGGLVNTLQLTLSSPVPDAEIRYTLDASTPSGSSNLYTSPILINSNTVVRAKLFKSGYRAGPTSQRTYLLNSNHELPIISLVTDPANLFDNDMGIYVMGDNASPDLPHFGANFWEDWERPVHLTIYEEGTPTYETGAGAKIFGGWSRANAQKSISLHARADYGSPAFDYKMFANRQTTSYQTWILRNSGTDFLNTNIRDASLTSLMEGADLELQAYRPMAVYINGEYWGFYHVREKINEHFLTERTGLHEDDIDILESNSVTVHGSNTDYQALISFISSNDLSQSVHYDNVAEQIDIDNLALYYATQIYFDNTDWPGNNVKYWKAQGGKWRWILFDTDFGFGIWDGQAFWHNTLAFALNPSGPNWPNPPWSTLLFRKLMTNRTFRNTFVNMLADQLNSRFLPGRVTAHIDAVSNTVQSEIGRHFNRWGGNINYRNLKVDEMKTFATRRPQQLKSHIRNTLSLPDFHRLTLLNPNHEKGKVIVNNRLTIAQSIWSGDYFQTVPITLEARPEVGYTFSHWEGDIQSTHPTLVLDLSQATSVRPIFSLSTSTEHLAPDRTHIEVFPNPTTELITISYTSLDIGPSQISIIDVSGSRLYEVHHMSQTGNNEVSIDLTPIPSGTYQIVIEQYGRTVSSSIVKL